MNDSLNEYIELSSQFWSHPQISRCPEVIAATEAHSKAELLCRVIINVMVNFAIVIDLWSGRPMHILLHIYQFSQL